MPYKLDLDITHSMTESGGNSRRSTKSSNGRSVKRGTADVLE